MSDKAADGSPGSEGSQGEVAELVASQPALPSAAAGTEYQSQGGRTPSYARSRSPSLPHESSSDSPQHDTPSPIQVQPQRLPVMAQIPQRPAGFTPADETAPMRAELVTYVTEVNTYITRVMAIYDFLSVPTQDRPAEPQLAVAQNVAAAATIWRIAARAAAAVNQFEAHLLAFRLQEAQNNLAAAPQAAPAAAAPQMQRHAKTSTPSKYSGKRGDQAATFMTGCLNYWQMEARHFDDKNHFIRWVLQLVEGDAGTWAHRQLARMETEQVGGRITAHELRRIMPFFEMFMTHFGDEGLAERDCQRWANGIKQKGKVVTYFQEVKEVMIQLQYDRDSMQTLDQVFTGLKPHNRMHFIGRRWASFNEMKSAVILYDAGHWAIHSSDRGSTPGTITTQPRDPSSQYTRGKSLTPQTAGVSKVMGRKLTDKEWEDCKVN